MKKIIITGGGGFLGFAIIKKLREQFPQAEIFSISRSFYSKLEQYFCHSKLRQI